MMSGFGIENDFVSLTVEGERVYQKFLKGCVKAGGNRTNGLLRSINSNFYVKYSIRLSIVGSVLTYLT